MGEDKGKEKKENRRGARTSKRITIIIIKEIHKSDTFFFFTNIDYVSDKKQVFLYDYLENCFICSASLCWIVFSLE